MTSTATQDDGQVWTDQRIHEELYPSVECMGYTNWVRYNDAREVAAMIVAEYEARLRTVEQERDVALQRVAKLEAELAAIERWELDDPIQESEATSE